MNKYYYNENFGYFFLDISEEIDKKRDGTEKERTEFQKKTEIVIEKVQKGIGWSDSDYKYPRIAAERCIEEGLAESFSVIGNSGVACRNNVILNGFKTVQISANGLERFTYEEGVIKKEKTTEEVFSFEIPDPEVRKECLRILKEEKDKEGQKELWSLFKEEGADVIEVSEFNKTLACHATQPHGVFSILKKTTSCGNSTVLLIRVENKKIRCPDKYKGLVIGAKGANINKISEAMGFRVQVE
ncbi:MAG: KH domain-containing protein [Candidatus Paceibacterota bacterium]